VSYEVRLARPVVEVLDGVDKPTEKRFRKRLKELGEDPYNTRTSKTLVNKGGLRSSRVGSWRILYTVNDNEDALYVLAIRPRGEAYRDL
jgi:mRNA interferase RelE/StbE